MGPMYLFLLYLVIRYVRDVGVAGSNPVTPTTEIIEEKSAPFSQGAS